MPEKIDGKSIFSLYEVSRSIQKTLGERYSSSFWVKAEMNKLNYYKHSGHCYPELVEKKDGSVIAQIRANLWRADYIRINDRFLQLLKEPLKDGIKILFEARISFDPVHGLALWIMDIDPAFTLGDLEAEKLETIRRLREEGVYSRNKMHTMPLLPQRIAVISVETSKGWADFGKVLHGNDWNYTFFCYLFPSLLQGDQAASAIIRQLNRIRKVKDHFDVVAIIRGGGGDVGLSCYNNYVLARAIALFPLPVITGIGHATNETVSEMVAFSNAITPTKLAEYLIQQFHNFSVPVQEAERRITEWAQRKIVSEKDKVQSLIRSFRYLAENTVRLHYSEIRNLSGSLKQEVKFRMKYEKDNLQVSRQVIGKSAGNLCRQAGSAITNCAAHIRKDSQKQLVHHNLIVRQLQQKLSVHSRLAVKEKLLLLKNVEKNIDNMNPVNVLKRGYSITLRNGKAVRSGDEVNPGDIIHTTVLSGSITSIVQQSIKPDHETET